jgi:hypothetical protein
MRPSVIAGAVAEMAKVHVPALIGQALEGVLAEVAANGNWRDRRKAEWLLAKLESCVSRNDELARLREPFTPTGIMFGNPRDLRFYLYDRHKAGPWR